MCVKLNLLFDNVLQQGIYIKTIYPNYLLEFRNTDSYLLQVHPCE